MNDGTTVEDAKLVEAWRSGDDAAANLLVKRHIGCVHRFFSTKAPTVADDLVQRTFAALVDVRDRIDPKRSFRAYLLGIARHMLLRHLRELARHENRFDPLETSVAQLRTTPSRKLERASRRRLVQDAMRSLPLDQQITLELYYWDEMSVGEIATVLEVAPGTVRARLTRARARLEDLLKSRPGAELIGDLGATLSKLRPADP